MKAMIKSAMLWRFLVGFAIGGVGVLALHPAMADSAPFAMVAAVAVAH